MNEKLCISPYLARLDTAYAAGGPGFSAVPDLVNDYSRRLAMMSTRPETRKLRELVTGPVGLYAIALYELARTQLAALPSTQRIADTILHKVMNVAAFYEYSSDDEYDDGTSGTVEERADQALSGSTELPPDYEEELKRKMGPLISGLRGQADLERNLKEAEEERKRAGKK